MIKDTSSKALQEISVHKKATLREKPLAGQLTSRTGGSWR